MAAEKFFSFAEIVKDRDASVRMTDDNMLIAVDLAMVMSGKERDYAGQMLRRLPDEVFSSCKLHDRTLPGKGNGNIKVVSFQNAIELIMVLPGKIAKETRSRFAAIIQRYLAGDKSLVNEIEINAASKSPIAQLARASMDSPAAMAVISPEEMIDRKRNREIEDALFNMEMAERKQRLIQLTADSQIKAAEAQAKVIDVQKMLMDTYTSLCPNRIIDDRARLMFKDNILNIASQASPGSAQLAIENNAGSSSGANDNKPITISTVAATMGHRFDNLELQKIGMKAVAAYKTKYGEKPGKHEQMVGQASILVNSYHEKDRDMIQEVIADFVKNK